MTDAFDALGVLFDRGGVVLAAIALVSVGMWFRLAEVAWLLRAVVSERDASTVSGGAGRLWRLRAAERALGEVRGWVGLPPMMGLLGTIVGMIAAFDALAMREGAEARALSLGVSQALLTTMAGLAASVLVLLAAAPLDRRVATLRAQIGEDDDGVDPFALSPLLALRARLHRRDPKRSEAD